jgi:DNA polymerase III psi subunit
MNSKTLFSLSEYQRAILTEIGITNWRQLETSVDVFTTQNDESNLVKDDNKDELFRQRESAEPKIDKQVKSIPERILLLIPETQSAHPLIQDVLNTLNLPKNALVTFSGGVIEDYADYLLAWKEGPETVLNGTILNTLDLSSLSSPEAKKHLWQILQNCHLFA